MRRLKRLLAAIVLAFPRTSRSLRSILIAISAAALLGACTSEASSPEPSSSASRAQTWDLVWFSDSSGNFVADLWASRIEDTQGVDVTVHHFEGPGVIGSASFIVDLLEVTEVENAIKQAEVIGLYTNPARTPAGDDDACPFLTATAADPPEVYSKEDFVEYRDFLREIYGRIFELRAGEPVIIRAMDLPVPILVQWRDRGIERECTAIWEAWTGVAREVAAEYGVPMASMYDAFNGPAHDEDPGEKGYIGADGLHPSPKGNAAQVDVLDALGYEPVEP